MGIRGIAVMTMLLTIVVASAFGGGSEKPVRVLVVTGGHDFDRPGFTELWRSITGVTVQEVAHPEAHHWLRPDRSSSYDVLLCYDMHEPIDDQARNDLVNLVRRGKGLIVLHHALANYQEWNEWMRIAGGRFRTRETMVNGVRRPPSTWKDDVAFRVHVVDPHHPVTKGIADFDIVDETYGDLDVLPEVKPLLTTDEPTSSRVIAWAHTYGRGRVVAIQSGHGPSAWRNPAFRQLLRQAIQWAARR